MRRMSLAPLALLMFAGLTVAGCHRAPRTAMEHAWVRLPAVPGRPGAAYFTLHAGNAPERLVAVDTPAAGSSELHESMTMGAGGMTGMRRLDGVDLPAGGAVRFAPGGNHVMLFGLGASLRAGDTVRLTARFAKGQPVSATAKVVGAGDAAPY